MTALLKSTCLVIYLLAIVAGLGLLPAGPGRVLQLLALALVAAHALESALVFGRLKAYPGPLIDSLTLALLFGVLHWKRLGTSA
ncbi:MAG TPA: hypothetical protein VMT50_09505 [Steroidobacteraceae bacterium]|nr:hypothetical protein [Steroidobacteraceae bacterium]